MIKILVPVFILIFFITSSFAFDCPKCKIKMTEREDTWLCPRCDLVIPITRINIYPKAIMPEKKTTSTNEEWEGKRKKLDKDLIENIKKIDEDREYDLKIKKMRELQRNVERLEGELRLVEDEMKKIDWERNMSTGTLPYALGFKYAGLKGRRVGIQEWIRRYEFEIETIKKSL